MDDTHALARWLGSGSLNIFGEPFAGKDTQGRVLAQILHGSLVAGGDILRGYHDQGAIQQVMASGDLLPSDLYLKIMLDYLSRPELGGKPLILSAVGRLAGEETVVMRALSDTGHPLRAVVLLQLGEEEVRTRFEASRKLHDRGERADDSEDALENRLARFRTQTVPVIEHYRQLGLLIEIDGTRSREDVTAAIISALAERAASA